jgi:putative methionine-R-sulfoxide reductase with GAF domain
MSTTNTKTSELVKKLDALGASAASAQDLMAGIAKLFHQEMLRYNWVGFYMLEKMARRTFSSSALTAAP